MKRKPKQPPTLMDRTRAAVAIVNSRSGSHALEMAGFLALFHPEIDPRSMKHLELMQRDRRRS